MRLPKRLLTFALAAASAALAVCAPARAQVPVAANVVASDFAFGGDVRFSYPSGASTHQVVFTAMQPSQCMASVPGGQVQGIRAPVPDYPRGPGWAANCTFTVAGAYPFICPVHPAMTGVVTAVDTGGPKPVAPSLPGLLDIPAGSSPRVAVAQRGLAARGSVIAAFEGSSLLVRAYARHRSLYASASTREVRVGRRLLSPVHGRVAFSVPLSAIARKALRREGRLPISVRIVVTPPPARGKPYAVTRAVIMRFGSRRGPDDPLAPAAPSADDVLR